MDDPAYNRAWAAVQTPFKTGEMVLAPSYVPGAFDSHMVDVPFVFQHEHRYHMTYVGYDGAGYRTGLASSTNPYHWQKEGMILDRGAPGSITAHNAALTWILRDNALFGAGELRRVNGRFLGTYHAYPRPGYEQGPAVIGLCWSNDLRRWEVEPPCLLSAEGAAWERAGLYKSCLVEHEGVYYLFYNAKNQERDWIEQTGVATSTDLRTWRRYEGNPVLPVGARGAFDDRFASDPCVLRMGDVWAMFYFGLCSDGHARDSVAFSRDLLHWAKTGEVLIDVGMPGDIDSRHAHKPSLFYADGTLFHYYCAVSPEPSGRIGDIAIGEQRGIALATGQPVRTAV